MSRLITKATFIYVKNTKLKNPLIFKLMLTRYCWTHRLYLINIGIFIFISLLFYNTQIKYKNSFFLTADVLNSTKSNNDVEKSIFQSRFNQRLLRLGQRFSHINITKLLHIQSTSTQTLTYFCSKHCGGWGDRLRGITSTYILAVLLQRRFTIDMQYPCNLTNFLLPNLVDWLPVDQPENPLRVDPMHHRYENELSSNISSSNLIELWSTYDHILLTTNSDYISIALKNPFFSLIKSQINIRSNESTQQILFPFIFELLFKPTSIVIDKLDKLFSNQPVLCIHIRIGQNPTVPKDAKLPFRGSIVQDMLQFIDKNLSQSYPSIFITSDSYQAQEDVYKHYGNKRMLSVSGPIIHIDRFDSGTDSNQTLYNGFLKVISDFYFLGECDLLLKARSGFSDWANRRRLNEYSNLYTYCRGIHRITGPNWRRPHRIC